MVPESKTGFWASPSVVAVWGTISSFFHSTVSPTLTVTVAGSNLNARIVTVTIFCGALPGFADRPALASDGNPAAAISASAANRTSVTDARLSLQCIGSSLLVTRLPTRGLLPAALDSGLHALSVLQVTFEQWHGPLES